MNSEALAFIRSQRVGVLAIEMSDGSPHSAALHFAFSDKENLFIFQTNPAYKKNEAFREGTTPRASFVVGANETDMRTFQVDGVAQLTRDEGLLAIYFDKFTEKKGKKPDDIFFTFEPTWWRFTDWTGSKGKTVWASDDE